MTSLSRRKPRTTAPRTRAAGRAVRLACLFGALAAGGTAAAQQPLRTGPAPTGAARPQPPARTAPTPTAKPAATAPALPPPSAGKVMYFLKPADALVPVGGTGNVGGEPVASAAVPPTPAVPAAPEVNPAPPLPLPSATPEARPVPDRPIPVVQPVVQPGAAQQPPIKLKETDNSKYTTLPSRDKIFVIYTDDELERVILARLRQDEIDAKRDPNAKYPPDLRFPAVEDVSGGVAYKPKTSAYPPMRTAYDALYVVHRRLHFEEKNSERYGWDMGFIQPVVSAMYFYKDVLLWPNHIASGCAYGFWDTNAGKCLPGSPTPYMLYPPGLTITGSVFETVLLTGLNFALP